MNSYDYWVYILECENNSYYIGYAADLEKRALAHFNGKAAKYTRSFKPNSMLCAWKISQDKSKAMQIEKWLKKLSRSKKQELLSGPETFEAKFNITRVAQEILAVINLKIFN